MALAGCGRTPREGEIYSEPGKFSIIPPAGWQIERQQQETKAGNHTVPIHMVVMTEAVDDDAETIGVIVAMGMVLPESVGDEHEDPAVRGMIEALQKSSAGGAITSDSVSINGTEWNRSVADITEQGILMRTTTYMVLRNKRCYFIMCSSVPPEAFDNYNATFDTFVESFRIE